MKKLIPQFYAFAKQFYKRKAIKSNMSYDDFYDFVVADAIIEALQNKTETVAYFSNLLNWRFISYIRKNKQDTFTALNENIQRSAATEKKSNLEYAIFCLDAFVIDVLSNTLKDKAINAKLIKISKAFEINTFLGIPLSKISFLDETNKKGRANRFYQVKKFDTFVKNMLTENNYPLAKFHSTTYKINASISSSEKAIELRSQGEVIKDNAKLLYCIFMDFESSRNTKYAALSKSKLLILSFTHFLKASFYFKEALYYDPNYSKARYNYAYCLKRLGKLEEAVLELQDCLVHTIADNMEKSRILECIGDTLLLKKDYESAISYFQEAMEFSPNDPELVLNTIEANHAVLNNANILPLLNKIIEFQIQLPLFRRKLILEIMDSYNPEISEKCLIIIKNQLS